MEPEEEKGIAPEAFRLLREATATRRFVGLRPPDRDDHCQICFDVCVHSPDGATPAPANGEAEAEAVTTLPCGHAYHTACLDTWLVLQRCCPTCRFEITPESLAAASPPAPEHKRKMRSLPGAGWARMLFPNRARRQVAPIGADATPSYGTVPV